MARRTSLLVGLTFALVAGACTPQAGTTTAPVTAAPVTAAPATVAPATVAPATAAPPSVAPGTTVEAKVVGSAGNILVAGSNGMTVYIFTKDVKDSGKSNCTGGCLETWPALTVAAGETPTGGAGISGTLATITREDNGALQVTYNGLPLYFFKNDQAPGDLNGVYELWETVAP
jgi:predicted lipoprotein with Yx(FWY)xxD motif